MMQAKPWIPCPESPVAIVFIRHLMFSIYPFSVGLVDLHIDLHIKGNEDPPAILRK